jgi:hypothetical protein
MIFKQWFKEFKIHFNQSISYPDTDIILEMKTTIISKIRKFMTENPTLVMFGLALAITLAIGAAVGTLDQHQALAFRAQDPNPPCGMYDHLACNP